jgi:hypothetical protein
MAALIDKMPAKVQMQSGVAENPGVYPAEVPGSEKNMRISVEIDDAHLRSLDRLASRDQRPATVREAIAEYLDSALSRLWTTLTACGAE